MLSRKYQLTLITATIIGVSLTGLILLPSIGSIRTPAYSTLIRGSAMQIFFSLADLSESEENRLLAKAIPNGMSHLEKQAIIFEYLCLTQRIPPKLFFDPRYDYKNIERFPVIRESLDEIIRDPQTSFTTRVFSSYDPSVSGNFHVVFHGQVGFAYFDTQGAEHYQHAP